MQGLNGDCSVLMQGPTHRRPLLTNCKSIYYHPSLSGVTKNISVACISGREIAVGTTLRDTVGLAMNGHFTNRNKPWVWAPLSLLLVRSFCGIQEQMQGECKRKKGRSRVYKGNARSLVPRRSFSCFVFVFISPVAQTPPARNKLSDTVFNFS